MMCLINYMMEQLTRKTLMHPNLHVPYICDTHVINKADKCEMRYHKFHQYMITPTSFTFMQLAIVLNHDIAY